MKEMSISEFKIQFRQAIKAVKAGEIVAVTSGKRKEVVGYFVSKISENKEKRKIGILEGKASIVFKDDFKMTTEEFLGL